MTELQIWVAMYLAIGIASVAKSQAGNGGIAFAIILWPMAVMFHLLE